MSIDPARLESEASDARRRWLGGAARVHYGRCDGCQRVRDAAGRPLLVARQERARRFLCLLCFEFGPGEWPEGQRLR